MTDQLHPLIGTVINNQYRVERKLGEGGMGMVFACRHVRLPHLRFAVKLLVSNFARHEQIRARFFREADAVSRLNHPNIIKVADFGELPDGQLYLVMPLLDGKPLDEYLHAAGKIGPHHALTLVAQIGSALRHLHGHDIVHRDLKPGNIFIERQNSAEIVQLLDFGIAKDARDHQPKAATYAGAALGTPSYMACEQYRDASAVTPAADIFALAVVLVQMLTGQLPWGYGQEGVLLLRQLQEPPQLGPEVPRAWIPTLTQALSPDPRQRPQSAREFILPLANALDALPPIWKSGIEIVDDVAHDLITNAAPDDATVRSGPSASASTSSPLPTLNARPARAGQPTTLGGSSGAMAAQTAPSPKRGTLALLGVGGAVLAGGLTFAVAQLGSRPTAAPPHVDAGAHRIIEVTTEVGADAAIVLPASAALTPPPAAVDAAVVDAPIDAPIDATRSGGSSQTAQRANSTKKLGNNSPRKDTSDRSTKQEKSDGSAARSPAFDPDAPAGQE